MHSLYKTIWMFLDIFGLTEKAIQVGVKASVDEAFSLIDPIVKLGILEKQDMAVTLTNGFIDGLTESNEVPVKYHSKIRTAFFNETTARLRHY